VEGAIEAVRRDKGIAKPIHISIDEWNVNYHSGDHAVRYTLRDALADGIFVHMMQRHANTVKMGNLAQTVNIIPCIETSPEGMFRQAIYWPLWLAANLAGPTLVDCWVDVEGYSVDFMPGQELPWLDVVATRDDANRRLIVSVINAHPDQEIESAIGVFGVAVGSEARAWTMNSDSVDAHNDFDAQSRVTIAQETVPAENAMSCRFPAHSQTVIEFGLG
jgi:alpha-L-arabinofuranosidase